MCKSAGYTSHRPVGEMWIGTLHHCQDWVSRAVKSNLDLGDKQLVLHKRNKQAQESLSRSHMVILLLL